jgi:hypothetical protein
VSGSGLGDSGLESRSSKLEARVSVHDDSNSISGLGARLPASLGARCSGARVSEVGPRSGVGGCAGIWGWLAAERVRRPAPGRLGKGKGTGRVRAWVLWTERAVVHSSAGRCPSRAPWGPTTAVCYRRTGAGAVWATRAKACVAGPFGPGARRVWVLSRRAVGGVGNFYPRSGGTFRLSDLPTVHRLGAPTPSAWASAHRPAARSHRSRDTSARAGGAVGRNYPRSGGAFVLRTHRPRRRGRGGPMSPRPPQRQSCGTPRALSKDTAPPTNEPPPSQSREPTLAPSPSPFPSPACPEPAYGLSRQPTTPTCRRIVNRPPRPESPRTEHRARVSCTETRGPSTEARRKASAEDRGPSSSLVHRDPRTEPETRVLETRVPEPRGLEPPASSPGSP